jgi:hypothetical protein
MDRAKVIRDHRDMWGYEEGRGEKRRGGDECRVNHGVWQQSR